MPTRAFNLLRADHVPNDAARLRNDLGKFLRARQKAHDREGLMVGDLFKLDVVLHGGSISLN